MEELIPLLSPQAIQARVDAVALQISEDYHSQSLVLIGVLKGAFIFLADLARKITVPVTIDFLSVQSYGTGTQTSGNIQLRKALEIDIAQKNVLIVEDIVDTGLTLSYLFDYLNGFHPRSIKFCAFIDKAERREHRIPIDYTCFQIDKGFLVGYGLDYAEAYRNLQGVYDLKFN
jgi:hypoxanthine phosphoribosyltransferase